MPRSHSKFVSNPKMSSKRTFFWVRSRRGDCPLAALFFFCFNISHCCRLSHAPFHHSFRCFAAAKLHSITSSVSRLILEFFFFIYLFGALVAVFALVCLRARVRKLARSNIRFKLALELSRNREGRISVFLSFERIFTFLIEQRATRAAWRRCVNPADECGIV